MVFEKENPYPSVQCHMMLTARQKAKWPAKKYDSNNYQWKFIKKYNDCKKSYPESINQ
jgi:hypothetical protein